MEFNEYQERCMKTAIYPELLGNNVVYPVLALCGESGEVAEKLKKILRDKAGKISDDDKVELKKELGDVLWYLAAISKELDIRLDEVAQANIAKVESRKQRNTTHGNGDNR